MSGNRCKKGWWSTNDGWLTDCQEEPQVQILGPGWRKLRAKYGPGSQWLTGWICCAAYHGYFWQDLRCLVYCRWDWLKMGALPQKSIGLSDYQWLSSFFHLRVYHFLGWAAWCTQRPSSLKRFGPVPLSRRGRSDGPIAPTSAGQQHTAALWRWLVGAPGPEIIWNPWNPCHSTWVNGRWICGYNMI